MPPRRLGIISPHLDDAVLSCAQVIRAHPGSVVVTVFAGRPPGDPRPHWDALYFKEEEAPMPARWAEDDEACGQLGATNVHLGCFDQHYGRPQTDDQIVAAVDAAMAEHPRDAWLVPLGVKHPDHMQCHRVVAALLHRHPDVRWIVYEELPYRLDWAEDTEAARALMRSRLSIGAVSLPLDADLDAKRAAINCYPSQLGEDRISAQSVENALTNEVYWEVRGPA